MIGKAIDAGAKMARLMFDMGRGGKSKEQALDAALKAVPPGMYSGKLSAALKHYFAN